MARVRPLTAGLMAAALLGLFAGPLVAEDEEAPPPLEDIALYAARAAAKDLGEKLKGQLMAAMASGGPIAALEACRTIAPETAADTSTTHGLDVRRTALKVRNPANAPDDFERRVLEDFVSKIAAGADVAKLEYSETVTTGEEVVMRYMKAIPTAAEPCLACHGSDVAPGLKAEILRLYPADAATGFKAGELRGAFSVKARVR